MAALAKAHLRHEELGAIRGEVGGAARRKSRPCRRGARAPNPRPAGVSAADRGAPVRGARAARREDLALASAGGRRRRRRCARLQAEYAPRGVNLSSIESKWTFRTANDLAWLLTQRSGRVRRSSRAPPIETLAIIAYHQPVTRAEIEDIRGVMVSKGTIDVLMETGWIKPRGRRKAPGRPLTFGTTEDFLVHFGLEQSAICRVSMSSRAPACSKAACRRASRCRCRPTIRSCARTKTRSSRAISILAWRRGRSREE